MIILNLLVIIVIAVSLSMDAFSLSLAYGTLNLEKKNINQLSVIVGIYHFIMPLFGMFCGSKVTSLIPISSDLLVFLVLTVIGIEMILDNFKKQEQVKIMKLGELVLFGLAVSIDSFSVGIGLKSITSNFLLAAVIFSLTSFLFTYVGLNFGKKINSIIGMLSTLIGGVVLVIIGILYLI